MLFSAYADDWLVVPALLAQADALLAQHATLDGALAPEDIRIAGMLLLGTPLREIAAASGLELAELGERIEQMLERMSVTHGPAVTYNGGVT